MSAAGSSGGSAAALASGQVWLATGNDLGGSLRTPAGFNGIVGLRPSPGVVPRGERLQAFDTIWVEGPMALNVADVALENRATKKITGVVMMGVAVVFFVGVRIVLEKMGISIHREPKD